METYGKFGRWTLLEPPCRNTLCRCECGTVRRVYLSGVRRGDSISCGCYKRECNSKTAHHWNRTHGMSTTPEYNTWASMKKRCHNPNHKNFSEYGARGIYVCDEWRKSFAAFYADMGPRPQGYSLERINNTGPYCKENCIWATPTTQSRNRRNVRLLDVDGEKLTIGEVAQRYGVNYQTLYWRIVRAQLPVSEAIKP